MKQGKENEAENTKEQSVIANEQTLNLVAQLKKEIEDLKTSKHSAQMAPGITMEDVAKLISAAVNTRDKDLDYQAGIREEEIPLDDYDEVGVRFCAPFTGHVITDDRRNGHRVVLPYNKPSIFFEYAATRRVQQGKYESLAPYCIYTSHSKKEIEWLKNHSFYGILFYETSTQAVSADIQKMQKLARIMKLIQGFEFIDLIKRSKDYNLTVSEDAASMRANLAYAMLKSEMESETKATERSLDETFKQAVLVGKQ